LSTKPETGFVDLQRFQRFTGGESIQEISLQDGIGFEIAKTSVRRGLQMFEAQQQIILKAKRYDAAIENEEIRAEARAKVKHKLVDAIDVLLSGKKTVIEVDRNSGAMVFHEITDPEIIAMGVEAARKMLSMEEKPTPSTIVNIQQNNNTEGATGVSLGLTFEERLARIQRAQSGEEDDPVIEAEATEVSETKEAEESPDEEPF